MQKIAPFQWFDHQAEEAMHSCVSIFENSNISSVFRYRKGGPVQEGGQHGTISAQQTGPRTMSKRTPVSRPDE